MPKIDVELTTDIHEIAKLLGDLKFQAGAKIAIAVTAIACPAGVVNQVCVTDVNADIETKYTVRQ